MPSSDLGLTLLSIYQLPHVTCHLTPATSRETADHSNAMPILGTWQKLWLAESGLSRGSRC